MNTSAYAKYLKETKKGQLEKIAENIHEVERFLTFLAEKGINDQAISRADATAYITHRREQGGDLYWLLSYITEYAVFLKNEELTSEFMLLHDAWNIMSRASELTQKFEGSEIWNKVFGGVKMPQIGSTLDEMTDFSRSLEKRALSAMPRDRYEHICVKNAHSWEKEWDSNWREQFLEAGSVDKFIEMGDYQLIKELEKCRDEGKLFFTQEVDDDVIEYVKTNPQFTRIGDKIHVKRMPFLTKRYLTETNTKMKRHYACHCAWIRNSILQPEGGVSKSFCYCSLGHDKRRFDIAFGQETTGRVIKTVMDEDGLLCLFEIDIPDEIMEKYVVNAK